MMKKTIAGSLLALVSVFLIYGCTGGVKTYPNAPFKGVVEDGSKETPQDGVSKEQNLENLKKVHAAMGWQLLMNEHVPLERNGQKIALVGIENWSAKARFPKHGRMDLAHTGTETYPFKILMSHDPSHWDVEVQNHPKNYQLTLSRHTHGLQFGIEIPGFLKWSPVSFKYPHWAALYENQGRYLYVNRGFGFHAYPGRVGIMPEITVLELKKR